MQTVSQEYKEAISKRLRNRGYIQVTIGVINREAQKNLRSDDENDLIYYSDNPNGIFEGQTVTREYATCEQEFSKVDGSMFFPHDVGSVYYYSGIVSDELMGSIKISFNGHTDLDIKGLTIDFSDNYPTAFMIEYDGGVKTYGNESRLFYTEDSFSGISYFIITPIEMANGQDRLRIYSFSTGVTERFTNTNLISYNAKQYVSPIAETLPSIDATIVVDNKNLRYCPDNADSPIAFMDTGQDVEIQFGYDIDDEGTIEWLTPMSTYLKSWSADDRKATFTSTDRFDIMNDTYYKGMYREDGITLYALAEDVFDDAGVEDYFIDPYLETITVQNPIPPVTHTSALQIIANAARCTLYEDENKVIHIGANFVPEMTASSPNEASYSKVENILTNKAKNYAESSYNYSKVDGSMFFGDGEFEDIGFVSSQISPFTNSNYPEIVIEQEAIYAPNDMTIYFGNDWAVNTIYFRVYFYVGSVQVGYWNGVHVTSKVFKVTDNFPAFNKMRIVFYTVANNTRIFVNRISFGVGADYDLRKTLELSATPTATRNKRIQSIDIYRNIYSKNEVSRELANQMIDREDEDIPFIFTNASYDYSAVADTVDIMELRHFDIPRLEDGVGVRFVNTFHDETTTYHFPVFDIEIEVLTPEGVTGRIEMENEYSGWVRFSGIQGVQHVEYIVWGKTTVPYEITDYSDYYVIVNPKPLTDFPSSDIQLQLRVIGSEYDVEKRIYSHRYHSSGEVRTWDNPLISEESHASEIESWLSEYYLGDIDYEITWRGDPRTEANDLFRLETAVGQATIKAYDSSLSFSNAGWKGQMKARKVYGVNELDNT